LRFDALESRLLLAGDVTVTVDGEDLLITGDAAANAVVVRGTETPGQYVVSRSDRTTTINGGTAPFTASNISNLVIDLGQGNDVLNLLDANISGRVSIDMGANGGRDVFNAAYAEIGETLDISTGGGDDQVLLNVVTVKGAANIDTGAGKDGVYLSFCDFHQALAVNTDAGKDVVTISAVEVMGATSIDTGSDSAKDAVVVSASRFRSAVSINLGAGNDELVLTTSRFDATLTADGGEGTDRLVNRFNRFLGGTPAWSRFERFPWI
jgi:hypothetical protein